MALDVYVKKDIARVLGAVYIAQQPGPEGCRTLVAVAVAFGCIELPPPEEESQVTAQKLLTAEGAGREC